MSAPASTGGGGKKVPTADEKMSPKEKDALADQIEDFEGPDRREKRGTEQPEQDEPGVARS